MKKIVTLLLLVVGIIHLLPLSGVVGTANLEALYGIVVKENNLSILMQHRAVMFSLLAVFFMYAAFKKELQPLAFILGFLSTFSFVALAFMIGNFNQSIEKVVLVDVFAMACLLIAFVLYWYQEKKLAS